ncbi:polyprotein [Apostichopus japonicus]|uniref:Polyprotein n=1 Tax=Stichopus japonicus TaxID=307972 RepID=A0A2G8LRJ1_STIJA|nr:polyprotein [Apostichopus japonicus]
MDIKTGIDTSDLSDQDWEAINDKLSTDLTPLQTELFRHDPGNHNPEILDRLGCSLSTVIYSAVRSHPNVKDIHRRPYYQGKRCEKVIEDAHSRVKDSRRALNKAINENRDKKEVDALRQSLFTALRCYSELKKKFNSAIRSRERHNQEKFFRQNFNAYVNKFVVDGQKSSKQPAARSQQTCETTLRALYEDENVITPSIDTSWTIPQPQPQHPFNDAAFTIKDVKQTLRRTRSRSAPGPDGISYLMLKKLPCVLRFLATLFSKIKASCELQPNEVSSVPSSWQKGIMIFIFKYGNPDDIQNYRPITLTSGVSKLFHSILNFRLLSFLRTNKLIDISTQKGFLNRIMGCAEHTMVLNRLTKYVKSKCRSMHIAWLDIQNAFGSVRHDVLEFSLQHHHIPQWLTTYLLQFYSNLQVQARTNNFSVDNLNINIGVFQGDTISPTIFLLVFNLILQYIETKRDAIGVPYKANKIISLAYADDLTLCTQRQSLQKLLNELNTLMLNIGLKLKAKKCVTFSLTSGIFAPHRVFKLGEEQLKTIEEKPMKFLGCYIFPKYQSSRAFQMIERNIKDQMKTIDALPIRGEYKLRIWKQYSSAAFLFS